jgi:hypothetical protein
VSSPCWELRKQRPCRGWNANPFFVVFSRCAGSLEEGRRLENLSWRLWNRETFCCDPVSEANATTPATSSSARNSEGRYTAELPDLSSSPDSVVDEEALEFDTDHHSTSNPLDISRPQIRRQDSASSRSRGRERHITPDDLEKMVSTIKENKDLKPLNLSISSLPALAEKTQPQQRATPPLSKASTVDDAPVAASATSAQPTSSESMSGTSERSTTSVVRGFSPAHVSSSYRSIPLLSAPSSIPSADIAAADDQKPTALRKTGVFALRSSSTDESSSEPADSMGRGPKPTLLKKKNPVFTFGGSSNEEDASLPNRSQPKSALTESIQRPPKKQTSFREEVATRTIHEEQPFDDDVFESDDDIDESAIDDDDDSSDWEDSNEDSGHASIDDKTFFQRVDSRPNLTSRRSLITTMLHQNDRANALATAASKSTSALRRSPRASPNGPSLATSVESDDESALMMKSGGLKPISEHPRFGNTRTPAQPIARAATTPHQLALSPRTTRRNMLATELTVSLRQNLLWERQQKSQTANAVLKRRHTAHDMADLKQYPEKVHMDKDDKDANASWNEYFSTGLGEYHSKGW